MKFGEQLGRVLQGSIYKDFVPPDVEDSKALLKGYNALSCHCSYLEQKHRIE